MDWTTATFFLRAATHGLLFLLVLRFIFVKDLRPARWIFVAFCTSVMAYLIVDAVEFRLSIWFFILLIGPFALPALFWLLSKALFDDHFTLSIRHNLILFGAIMANFGIFWVNNVSQLPAEDGLVFISGFLSQAISLCFVVLAVVQVYAGREADLLEERLGFRRQFVIITTLLIGLTLLAEVVLFQKTAPLSLEFIHKLSILLLTAYFALRLLQVHPHFLKISSDAINKPKEEAPAFLSDLQVLLQNEKVFREEGLTIGKLAEKLDVKEYKLRRAINDHLGFRNFNDFLNQYRVQEACEILLDPQQKELTILEIAYQLGYQSIGPFNAAFKKHTALTPTGYRKAHLTV